VSRDRKVPGLSDSTRSSMTRCGSSPARSPRSISTAVLWRGDRRTVVGVYPRSGNTPEERSMRVDPTTQPQRRSLTDARHTPPAD
jgi:hypothetical protein